MKLLSKQMDFFAASGIFLFIFFIHVQLNGVKTYTVTKRQINSSVNKAEWDYQHLKLNSLLNSSINNYYAKKIFTSELEFRYQKLEKIITNRSKITSNVNTQRHDCMNGAFEYNKTCIYFSNLNQRLTWLGAEKFCRKMPLNTSFLTIKNEHQLEFLRRILVKIKEKEKPKDQLVFLIEIWTFINGIKLREGNFSLIDDESLESNSTKRTGSCGSIALNKEHHLIMKSAPCLSTKMRFVCEYSLNPCYFKDMCGKNGQCVNLFQDFYCDCYPFFTGKFCENFDSKAIQILIGIIIVVILLLSMIVMKIKQKTWDKQKSSSALKKSSIKDIKPEPEEKENYPIGIPTNKEPITRSISKLMRKSMSNFARSYLKKKQKSRIANILSNIFHILPIIALTAFQIICIHSKFLDSFEKRLNLDKIEFIVKGSCDFFDKYLFEELIYLIFVCFLCLLLIVVKKKRRYSEVVTRKHKDIIEKNLIEIETSKIKSYYLIENQKKEIESINRFAKLSKKIKSNTSKIIESSTITPSIPFSLKGRANTACVYVLYTYDVLNILMSVYAESIGASFISNASKLSGVLVDLLFQLFQVFLIGFKFYPILAACDADPNPIVYFFTFVYLLFMFMIRLMNKAFCSQKTDFARRTLTKLSKDFTSKLKNGLELRYNISNKILGVFSDDPNPNEKYIEALKSSIPSVFRDVFQQIIPEFNASEREVMNNFPLPSNYYEIQEQNFEIPNMVPLKNTTRRVFVNARTEEKITDISKKISSELSFLWQDNLSILENLPLYFALAFLLMKFFYKFFQSFNEDLLFENKVLKKNPSNQRDIQSELNLKENAFLPQDSEKRTNSNVEYIKRIVKEKSLLGEAIFVIPEKKIESKLNKRVSLPEQYVRAPKRSNSIKEFSTSWMLNKFEVYIYRPVPNLKYSKQFFNTYTVAFMIVYLFSIYGLKVSNVFSQMIVKFIYLMFKFILSDYKPFFKLENLDFRYEFRIASTVTSLIATIQLLLSIRKFRKNLVFLNKGEKFFSSLLIKHQRKNYVETLKKSREAMKNVTADALHFPGYLVAHLVYGYFLILLGVFFVVVMCKFVIALPRASLSILQIFLPLIILIFLKHSIVQSLTKLFLDKENKSLYKIAPYYIASYFYFFFDCFLGLASCMSRAFLTNIISLLTLTRIDVSMFNSEQPKVIRDLDRAYIAYESYVKMEHYYNNPIVNGFCELIVDSMFTTYSNKKTIEDFAKNGRKIIRQQSSKLENIEVVSTTHSEKNKKNKDFDYKSFKRLRNIIFLIMFLKSNDLIRSFRHKKWLEDTAPNQMTESFKEYLQRKIFDRLHERASPKIKFKSLRKNPISTSRSIYEGQEKEQNMSNLKSGSVLTLIEEEKDFNSNK